MLLHDGQLVAQARKGATCAFAELVSRYRKMVCGLAYHHLGNMEDAQDLAQEAFVDAYLHLRELREPDKFAPWLQRIALNRCVAVLRQRGHQLLSMSEVADNVVDRAEMRAIDGGKLVSDDHLEQLSDRLAIRRALSVLSDKTRMTVILCYMGGYSHAEIAAFLDIPVNTVRSRLQQAKRQLREEMAQMEDDMRNVGAPDPQFIRRVVETALHRAEEAKQANNRSDAVRYYDEALAALEQWKPDREQRRLKIEALRQKADVTQSLRRGYDEAIACFEQALAIAIELGDRKSQADIISTLSLVYNNAGQPRKAEERHRQALNLYRELGDDAGQGKCLLFLGLLDLWGDQPGKRDLEQALPLLDAVQDHQGVAICRASLDLRAEVEKANFPRLLGWRVAGSGCHPAYQ